MHVLILEPLSSGIELVKAARRDGIDVTVFSAQKGGRAFSEMEDDPRVSVIKVDTYSAKSVISMAKQLQRDLKLTSVIPGWEYCVDVAAEAARHLGLPHLSTTAAVTSRNKLECRERMNSVGIEVPRYAKVRTIEDIKTGAGKVGFPAVFKPIDGGGSVLVRKVDSLPELREVFLHTSTGIFDVDHFVGTSFILEEFIDGPEFSIEGYVDCGEPKVVAVTEKSLGEAPFFAEMGHIIEAGISAVERESLVKYIEEAVRAIDLNIGAFHAEARVTHRGPVLIEINCRLGGGRITRMVELAKGVSLPTAMVRSYCSRDIPAESVTLSESRGIVGVRFLSAPEGVTFGDIRGLEEVREMPGCEEVEIYLKPGDIVPRLTDFSGRIGHVMFTANDRQELDRRLSESVTKLQSLIVQSFQ